MQIGHHPDRSTSSGSPVMPWRVRLVAGSAAVIALVVGAWSCMLLGILALTRGCGVKGCPPGGQARPLGLIGSLVLAALLLVAVVGVLATLVMLVAALLGRDGIIRPRGITTVVAVAALVAVAPAAFGVAEVATGQGAPSWFLEVNPDWPVVANVAATLLPAAVTGGLLLLARRMRPTHGSHPPKSGSHPPV